MPSFSSPVRVVLRVRTTHRHGVQAVYDRIKRIDKDGDGKLSIHELYDVVEEAVAAKQARAPLPRPLAVPAARRTRAP